MLELRSNSLCSGIKNKSLTKHPEEGSQLSETRNLGRLQPPSLNSQLEIERAARIRSEERERDLEVELERGNSEILLLRRTAIQATNAASVRGILQPTLEFFGEHWGCEFATAWVIASSDEERWQHSGCWYFRDEVREPAFRVYCGQHARRTPFDWG